MHQEKISIIKKRPWIQKLKKTRKRNEETRKKDEEELQQLGKEMQKELNEQ